MREEDDERKRKRAGDGGMKAKPERRGSERRKGRNSKLHGLG